MHRIALLTTVVAFAATPLAAQHAHPGAPPQPPMMAGMMHAEDGMGMAAMDSMMAPLHTVMVYAPQRLLERKAALQLGIDQESRLARIAAASRAAHDSAWAAADQHRGQLQEAVAAAVPDPASVAAHFEAMHAAMGAAHQAMLRAALEARVVLTVGQRGMVDPAGHDAGMHRDDGQPRGGPPQGHEGHHPPRRP